MCLKLQDQSEVLRCLSAVRAFCALQEAPGPDQQRWLQNSLRLLSDLYACSHSLPQPTIDEKAQQSFHSLRVEDAEWRDVYDEIDHLLGSSSAYWGFTQCIANDEKRKEPHLCDLTQNLADIYRQLKPGLRAWDSQEEQLRHAAVFSWKPGCASKPHDSESWGVLGASVIGALHCLCYGSTDSPKHPRF